MDHSNKRLWVENLAATGSRLILGAGLLSLCFSAPLPGLALGIHDAMAFGLTVAPAFLVIASFMLYVAAFWRRRKEDVQERFARAASYLFAAVLWSSIGGTAVQTAFPIRPIHLTLPMHVVYFLVGSVICLAFVVSAARFLVEVLTPFGWESVRKIEKVMACFQTEAASKGGPVSRI